MGFGISGRELRTDFAVGAYAWRVEDNPADALKVGAVKNNRAGQGSAVLGVAQFQGATVELGVEEIEAEPGGINLVEFNSILHHVGLAQGLLKGVVFLLLEALAVDGQLVVQGIEAGGVGFFDGAELQLQRKEASLLGVSSLRPWLGLKLGEFPGDDAAARSLEQYASLLARSLAHVITILDPDVIVLGGGLSNIGQLYALVPEMWGQWVFSDRVDTKLVANLHGDSSGVRGAAWLWPEPELSP